MSPLIRTPREWDERCTTCDGAGIVHRKQSFNLWTPDEYTNPYAKPEPLEGAPADAYVCTVQGGAGVLGACTEGIEIAGLVGRPVAFVFNGTTVVCLAGDDPVTLAARWADRIAGRASP